jgi:hypothetical protein
MARRAFVVAVGLAAAGAGACSGVQQQRIGINGPDSSEAAFGPVADYLEHRCGTLDCHGQPGRNLRIWGCNGMRLKFYDIPLPLLTCNALPSLATPEEHQATYRSLVGLEPSVMSFVVGLHGQQPELLTFVRKARGLESHKGGQLITPGDDQDTCITSWLAGTTDIDACRAARRYPIFPMLDASTE